MGLDGFGEAAARTCPPIHGPRLNGRWGFRERGKKGTSNFAARVLSSHRDWARLQSPCSLDKIPASSERREEQEVS